MRKELWFGLTLMAILILATIVIMPAPSEMTRGHVGLLMLTLVVVVIMLGFPTAFTLMGMGVLFTWLAYRYGNPAIATQQTLDLMVQRTYAVMTNDVLIAVPLFVFMGYMVERANLIARLFTSLHLAMSFVPGSLAVATLVTCAVFATATGIIGAVVTLMGLLALPSMLRSGYDIRLSAGAITAGGCLGILIPPSVLLILYGATAGVSVVQLYAGAFFPGLMLAALYVAYVIVLAKLKPHLAPMPPEEERRVVLPARSRMLSGGVRTLAMPRLVSALLGRPPAGVPRGFVFGQLFLGLLPAIVLFAGLYVVYGAITKEAYVYEGAAKEIGDWSPSDEFEYLGIQEPPTEEEEAEPAEGGLAEAPEGALAEPPADPLGTPEGGLAEPPAGAPEPPGSLAAVPEQPLAAAPEQREDPRGLEEPPGAAGVQEPPGLAEPPGAGGVQEPPGAAAEAPAGLEEPPGPGAEAPEGAGAPTAFWIVAAIGIIALALHYAIFTFERLEILKMLLTSFFPLATLILAVLGSIIFGWATPTEAAALGSAGAMLLTGAYRQFKWTVLKEAVFLTAKTTAMVCWLFVGSSIFSAAFALLGGQALIERWVLGLDLSPIEFMLLAQVIIFILGWPLEWTEIIVIFMPIFIPLLGHFGIDPLFFGLLVAMNLQTAFLSPPVAMAAFYLKGVAPPGVTLNQIFAGMLPFMAIQVVAIAILYLFPQIGLWLPGILYR